MTTDTNNKKPYKKREIRPPKKITERYLYNSGLYYLQRFVASTGHFKTVMMRKIRKSCKHHTDQDIEECTIMLDTVTEKFVKQGHLNDDLYTTGMVNSLRRSGKSARAITAKLQQKRVPADLIKAKLDAFENNRIDQSESAEFEAALRFAQKRRIGPFIRPDKVIDDPAKQRTKDMAKMARAGFAYDMVKRVMAWEDD